MYHCVKKVSYVVVYKVLAFLHSQDITEENEPPDDMDMSHEESQADPKKFSMDNLEELPSQEAALVKEEATALDLDPDGRASAQVAPDHEEDADAMEKAGYTTSDEGVRTRTRSQRRKKSSSSS